MIDRRRETEETLSVAYTQYPSDGMFDEVALKRGEAVLMRCGLLTSDGGTIRITSEARDLARLDEPAALDLLTRTLLNAERPPWLHAALGDVLRWEYVPDKVYASLAGILPDLEERERFLLELGRTFDGETLHRMGEEGEEYVVYRCRDYLIGAGVPALADRVVRVSLMSDQLGYDIVAPDTDGVPLHLEVKAIGGRQKNPRVFLSRNEAAQGERDPRWALVVCQGSPGGDMTLRGWCSFERVRRSLPIDSTGLGRWVKAEITLDEGALDPGLPLHPGMLTSGRKR